MSIQPPAGQSQQPQKSKTGLMAIIAILAMLAAGCGSDTDTAAPAETAEETSAAAPAPTSEDPEPEPDAIAGDGTSFVSPLPLGSVVSVIDSTGPMWDIQVLDVDWDYTQADFPESPLGVYIALNLEVTNISDEPLDPYQTIYWDFGDGYGNFYDESIQVADEDLANVGEVAPGETATGVVVFEVPPAGLSHGVVGFNYTDRGLGGYTWVEVE